MTTALCWVIINYTLLSFCYIYILHKFIVNFVLPRANFRARTIHNAITGAGTDEVCNCTKNGLILIDNN